MGQRGRRPKAQAQRVRKCLQDLGVGIPEPEEDEPSISGWVSSYMPGTAHASCTSTLNNL